MSRLPAAPKDENLRILRALSMWHPQAQAKRISSDCQLTHFQTSVFRVTHLSHLERKVTLDEFREKSRPEQFLRIIIVHFSIQFSCSVVSDSLRPHEPQQARPPCPSPTRGVHPNPCPLNQWCHPTISSSINTPQYTNCFVKNHKIMFFYNLGVRRFTRHDTKSKSHKAQTYLTTQLFLDFMGGKN